MMSTDIDRKIAFASILVHRAAIGLDDANLTPSYVVEPEGTTMSEEAIVALLAAASKPMRLSVARDVEAIRVQHDLLTDAAELECLRRRSSATRAYWHKRLPWRDAEPRVLLCAGRLRMKLTFEEY